MEFAGITKKLRWYFINGLPFEVQTLQITSYILSLISMQFSMEFSE
ncbi:hypothetical protein PspKH34_05630 [Parageobacillus sp. KH3-4]|jgi:hypothetical protein|nr:hypothetical protein PspKH34_05630 [Parageobacillus sp. KH3-4]